MIIQSKRIQRFQRFHIYQAFFRKSGAGFTLIEGIIAIGIISTAMIVGLTLAYSNYITAQDNANRTIASHLAREAVEVIRNVRDSNYLRRDAGIDKDCFLANQQGYACWFSNGTTLYKWDDISDYWPAYFSASDGNPVGSDSGSCPNGNCGNYFDIYDRVSLGDMWSSYPYGLGNITTWGDPNQYHYELFACMADPSDFTCHIQKAGYKYVHAWEAPPGASNRSYTQFYRRVLLKPICWDSVLQTEKVLFNAASPTSLCTSGQKVGMLVTASVAWKRGTRVSQVQIKERLYDWR